MLLLHQKYIELAQIKARGVCDYILCAMALAIEKKKKWQINGGRL